MHRDLKKSIKAIQLHLEDFQGDKVPSFEEKVDEFLNDGPKYPSKKKRR